jgi:hypothetical protein
MKRLCLTLFLLSAISFHLLAQEIDTIPFSTKDLDIKLKRSPLPSRVGTILFKPVSLNPVTVNAKVNYWKTKTSVGINVNQAAFSDNWKGGGVNSFALGGLINYKAEYSKESYSYVSEVILQYGKIKNKSQLQKKTTDRIYWDNKAAVQLSKNWYFFGSLNFESQFDRGFAYSKDAKGNEIEKLLSKFMSPGYLTESIGFEYKPNKFFSTRIGTGTARQTFVLDTALYRTNPNNFGVIKGKNFRNELAFQIVTAYEKEIFTNVTLKTRYNMFIPYDNFGHIDHRLDVNMTAKINRFMNVSLTGVGLYDRDTDKKVQGSQTLALGLTFIFPR